MAMDGLRHLAQGRTVIMITHDLDTIRHADSIIVLHDGIVSEQGTHDELLSLRGIYAELYWARTAAAALPREPYDSQRTDREIAWGAS